MVTSKYKKKDFCQKRAYKEFCGTFTSRSSAPPVITRFVPVLSETEEYKKMSTQRGTVLELLQKLQEP
jgi:hypothetical protein